MKNFNERGIKGTGWNMLVDDIYESLKLTGELQYLEIEEINDTLTIILDSYRLKSRWIFNEFMKGRSHMEVVKPGLVYYTVIDGDRAVRYEDYM